MSETTWTVLAIGAVLATAAGIEIRRADSTLRRLIEEYDQFHDSRHHGESVPMKRPRKPSE